MTQLSMAAGMIDSPPAYRNTFKNIRNHSLTLIAGTCIVAAYLVYIFFSFNVSELISRSQPARAVLLATDAVAYKVHITQFLKKESKVTIAVEGERTAVYDSPPEWIVQNENLTEIEMGKGYRVVFKDNRLSMTVPEYGVIEVTVTETGVETTLPVGIPVPEWLKVSPAKFEARPTIGRRVQVSKTRIEVYRYFLGWENFFFPFHSQLSSFSAAAIVQLALSDKRLQTDMANWQLIFTSFWHNPDWRHGHVFIALLETLLMAVLGTITAALVGLPLAILAASNFTPAQTLRFAVRRLFDFLRGIDMLIWSLIFIRAFGLGPLTGSLAIAFTDTGSLGKLFSEALESVNKKQMEGVHATGANRWQFYRFGVIPQIMPVFVSQCLYYLESNIRSATIIGALGAGGIGLMLVETMNTQRDWENTLYLILLTIGLVVIIDNLSSKLRRRLIHGRSR